MKKKFYIFAALCLINCTVLAQDKNNIDQEFDLLKAPISPASNLLGFSQSDIDKPTDVSAFMASLQTATNSFSQLPSNYAIDIAPFWLFKKESLEDITTKGLGISRGKKVLKETLVLSFAVKNTDTISNNFNPTSTYAALGFRFSIYRGKYDKTTNDKLTTITKLQKTKLAYMKIKHDEVYDKLDYEIKNDSQQRENLYKGYNYNDQSPKNKFYLETLEKKADSLSSIIEEKIEKQLESKKMLEKLKNVNVTDNQKLIDEEERAKQSEMIDDEITKIAKEFQISRVNFTWDIAGGISSEFRNKNFNNSKVYNSGIWTTLGYTWEKSGSLLGLVRYLYNPDKIFALENQVNNIDNVSTLDTGVRYIIGKSQSKFNCSVEVIYRSVLSPNTIDSSWRLMLNADYAILKNQKLTFSFGRNYDGTTTKDGNLIAALGFVVGFGNER
ncbi:hypothetical protein [Flavobacterium sp.]|uniref:hypothetical protein n=1 Tax=Flavobacterium sp. TaxID=239 RepID=UPI002EDA9C06